MLVIYQVNLASHLASFDSISHISVYYEGCVGGQVHGEEPTVQGGLCGPTWRENGLGVTKNGA